MANNPKTFMGGVRTEKGSPCMICGTKYLTLYGVDGKEICHNCFKKHYPKEWQLFRKYRFYAAGLIPFEMWLDAGCPTNSKIIQALRHSKRAEKERYAYLLRREKELGVQEA